MLLPIRCEGHGISCRCDVVAGDGRFSSEGAAILDTAELDSAVLDFPRHS